MTKLIGKKGRGFPYTLCPYTSIASSVINILHQSGMFVITDESMLGGHNYPKSIIYLRVHTWFCIANGFGQIYNVMYPSLSFYLEYFYCPRNHL